ncbi:ferredoxin [Streptomyces fuscichromogenes]|uniref:ferredoxin n=1 Tax=Streptomyces fuscichromogenes TaxID=1324013 RepID=UPI003819544B
MHQHSLKVSVDADLCIGNGMCRQAAPRTFLPEDHGQSVVAESPPDAREQILHAASACPVAAIVVRDAGTGDELFE